MYADHIYHNGIVYTVDEKFSVAEAFAVKDGKILATGGNDEILSKYIGERSDLQGKYIYPGFIDPHCHLLWYGYNKLKADLRSARSFAHAILLLKEHDIESSDHWVLGYGWDQNTWQNKEFPSKGLLDEAFPDQPVFMERTDTHAAVVNSKALEIAGISGDTEVSGGIVEKMNGIPTGILVDKAMDLVRQKIPPFTKEQKRKAFLKAQEDCVRAGLTSIADAYLHINDLLFLEEMEKESSVVVNISCMMFTDAETFSFFREKGIYRSEKIYAGAFKFFADGTLGSHSAYLLSPYADAPGNTGLWMVDKERFSEVASFAAVNGFQVMTHCIGDATVREVLHLYGKYIEPHNNKRWRIEHVQMVHPDDLHLFGKYNIIPSIQAIHATSDAPWVEKKIGKDRLKYSYPYRSLIKTTGLVANGSDFPIEPLDPLAGFHAAVFQRKDVPGYILQHKNKLSREEALKAMTIWAAYANYQDETHGSISSGKCADFVILEHDIMTIPEEHFGRVKVQNTYIDGKKII